MRRRVGVFASVLALCAVVLAAPSGAAPDPVKARRAAQERANKAAARLSAATSALDAVEAELAELEARTGRTQAELTGLQTQVRELAVNQYVHGRATPAPLFDGDLSRVARGQALARYVTMGNTDAIDGFKAAREDFELGSAAVEKRLAERRAAAQELRKQRRAALGELDKLQAAEKVFLARQAAEREAAERRASAARKASSSSRPGVQGPLTGIIASGSWICPVQGPRAFSNDWGQPRSGGRRHQGNDILAPRGTPVVASVSGFVKHHNSSLGGLSYYLNGEDGNTYFGTHLSAYAAAGRVSAGTVVGYVGDSGNARGTNHLHFEIHPGGRGAVNPFATLSAFC